MAAARHRTVPLLPPPVRCVLRDRFIIIASRVRVAAADADDVALEPISVPNFDALPWTVRWMCAAEVEASGMVEALACAAHADGLFGALRVRPAPLML